MRGRQTGGDAGGQPHGGERGDHLEQDLVQADDGGNHDGDRGEYHGGHGQQDDGQSLPLHVAVQATAEDIDRALAAHFGVDDEEENGKGGDLDAAGRARTGAADEHQDVHTQPGRGVHSADVETVESGAPGHRAPLEEAGEYFVTHV